MAVKNEIEITINEDGTVSLGVKGVKGQSCTELTKFLEEELGAVVDRKYTSEFYEEDVVHEKIKLSE